ncbi:MAG TPA: hypothetical protein VI818_08785, partial [Candidatus Thermoplasmatota archaeon]|nr:hypothetical protein [Candidatus Thermoplasmatota archaeon]
VITQTSAGNDVRAWTFQWVAPSVSGKNATFTYWANAVNGDTTTQNDQWAKGGLLIVPPKAGANATTNATTGPSEDTPFVSGWVAAAALVFVAAAWGRRRD